MVNGFIVPAAITAAVLDSELGTLDGEISSGRPFAKTAAVSVEPAAETAINAPNCTPNLTKLQKLPHQPPLAID